MKASELVDLWEFADSPIGESYSPPYGWYMSPEFLELEKHKVFTESWQCVGRLDQVQNVGDYFTGTILGNPYVIVRNDKDTISGHNNVCIHRAAQVALGQGHCSQFTCPYHGWAYHLDGTLKSAPNAGKQPDIKHMTEGLRKVHVKVWHHFIFINFSVRPVSFDDGLSRELEDNLVRMGMEKMKFHSSRTYKMKCNWKTFVDNSLDGGYHVGYAHEALAAGLGKDYQTHIFSQSSIQICNTKEHSDRLGDGVAYAWLWPNLFINIYGSCMETNLVVPTGPETCEVIFDFYFNYENLSEFDVQKKIKNSLAQSDIIQGEDITICESSQRGMESKSYPCGRYSSKLEQGVKSFHDLLYNVLKKD